MSDIVYSYIDKPAEKHRHIFAIVVDNEAGVLARVIGLFSGRGYNIESLTVAEIDAEKKTSRITIVTTGDDMIIEQIRAQLERLVPVHTVFDLTVECKPIERELAMVKVRGKDEKRRSLTYCRNFPCPRGGCHDRIVYF
ncbi:MAG: acetolactate synthase small subunit [Rickettsiales bacterium]